MIILGDKIQVVTTISHVLKIDKTQSRFLFGSITQSVDLFKYR